ncbi:spore germination protein KC [Marinithermofilum abyssi]|uniref:Spore germination protein KC n=1 Tax=Marinithermofilum abyssi TaxID=1571185 RepID=A0A8J2Y952_9BACL|nr:Ger(x)C family spore germination protein [Marinithermofilum abyssi]GGE15308.1 spore germination protein KC [Marinithermofilum abyssi]
MRPERLKGAGKRALCLLLMASLPILPGCWDRKELNEIALIRAVGIDRTEDGQIEVTILQAIPVRAGTGGEGGGGGGGGGGGSQQMVLSARGITIPEAKAKLQEKMGRRIFTGHQELVVLGKRLAKTGIREALDFFARFPGFRKDAFLFVTESSPKEIFETVAPGEPTATETLYKMVKLERAVDITIMRVLQEVSGDAEAAVIPVVMKVNDTTLALDGAAVFRGDKMVDHLDRKAAEGLLWIRNEFISRIINTRLPGERGYVSLEVTRSETELIPKIEGKKRRILLKVTAEDDVHFNGTRLSLYNPSVVDRIARPMERILRDRIRRTVKKVQKKSRADVLGFARAFHREYPEEWAKMKDHWNEQVFPRLDVDIQVRVHIRRPGVTDRPAGLPE